MRSAFGENVPVQAAHRSVQPDHHTADRRKLGVAATLNRYYRRAKAIREIDRLIRLAPTATIRDDLMAIAARNELAG
jgi:hypothetical protein